MSDILLKWLVEEVGLALNIHADHSIEREFADGYTFGQLFDSFNLQPDLQHFSGKGSPDAMVNNYTRLQDTFKKLGIPMDTRTAGSLMREEPGVAKRLLYSIKRSVGGLTKDLLKSQKTGKLGRELGATLVPSKVFLDTQKFNTQKEKYESTNQRFFEDIMRSKADNPTALFETAHLRKFAEAGDRTQAVAARGDAREAARAAEAKATLRHSLLDSMADQRQDKTKRLDHDDAVHAAILKHKDDVEKEELRVEIALSEKARRKRLQEINHASLDTSHGIDAFETNMKRLLSGDEGDAPLAPPMATGARDHMERMRGMAQAPGDLLAGTRQYLDDVNAQRKDEIDTRREREARRRRLVVEQQQHSAEQERKAQAEALLSALARQSAEEQRVAARLWQLGREKEVMVESRALREQQYAARREKDWEETLRRELELHHSLREQYEEEARLESQAWQATQAQHAEERAAKHALLAQGTAWQLVMLAERAIEYRAATSTLVPKHEYRKWIAMFLEGSPELGEPVADPESADELVGPDVVLGRATATDYMDCVGAFEGLLKEPVGHHAQLGKLVSDLAAVVRDRAANPGQPWLHHLALRVAVVGAPCAGKSTAAQMLSRKFRLKVLEPEGLLADALAAAAAYDPTQAQAAADASAAAEDAAAAERAAKLGQATPEPRPPTPLQVPRKVALGRAVQPLLQEGREIGDEVLVELVVMGMQESQDWVVPQEVEYDAKGKAKPKKAVVKGAAPEDTSAQGFVLDGFPRTSSQARLLEAALTGLDLAAEQAIIDSASLLAPPPAEALPVLERPRTSGLDAYLVLGLSDESAALKRALGRRLDKTTGRVYHLEFDPPPATDPGLSARLVEVQDASNDAQQIQARLVLYGAEAVPLDDWLVRFVKLRRPVDGTAPLADVLAAASDIAEGILRAKAAANSARAAALAAHKARASAEKAQEFAELAQGHAEAAARGLLAAKKAEIAATALLMGPGGVAPPKNPKEAPKEVDIAATEVLKAQAAAKCAESLKVCKGATTDAEGYAERAAGAAATAAEEAERAAKSLGDAEVNAHAETTAKAAAEDAEKASAAASVAAGKAEVAKQAAELAVAEAEKWLAALDVPIDAQVHLAERCKTPVEEVVDLDALAAARVPFELAGALLEEWNMLEATYFEALALGFGSLHSEHQAVLGHLSRARGQFLELLRRPDSKPAMVTTFQQGFNAIDIDARVVKETQAELVLRAEELREAMWAVVDRKAEEAEGERARFNADSFVADHMLLVGQSYNGLLQTELDRFFATVNFMRGHSAVRLNAAFPPDAAAVAAALAGGTAALPAVDLIPPNLAQYVIPAELKDKLDEKSKTLMTFPAHVHALGANPRSANLGLSLKIALASVRVALSALDPAPVDTKKSRKEGSARGAGAAAAAGGKAVKGKKPEEVVVVEPDPAMLAAQEAVSVDLLAAAQREAVILEARLQVLSGRAAAQLEELAGLVSRTHDQMGTWTKERCQAECSAVAALDRVIKEAAYASRPLPHDMTLEDVAAVVDENALHFLPPPPQPVPVPRESQPPAGLLSTGQMQALVAAFTSVAPEGYLRLMEAAELLCRMAGEGKLPDGWRSATSAQMLGALGPFDPVFSGFIDWREVLTALIGAAFPVVFNADGPEMVDQLDMCLESDRDETGRLDRESWASVELWFQYKAPAPGGAADLEADHVPKGPAPKDVFDSMKGLKDVLWDLFSYPPPPSESGAAVDGEATLEYTTMLLYLCADRDLFTGIRKAVNIATRSNEINPKATAAQLLALAYPRGMDSGRDIHRSPLDLAALQAAVRSANDPTGALAAAAVKTGTPKAAANKPAPEPVEELLMSAEQLMYSAAGERVVAHLLGRYQWKDAYIGTRL